MSIEVTGTTLSSALKYLWYTNNCDSDRVREIIGTRELTEKDFPALEAKIKGIDKELEEAFGGYFKFKTIADDLYPSELSKLKDGGVKIPICFAYSSYLFDEEIVSILTKENPYMIWIETDNPLGEALISKLRTKERSEEEDFQYCYYIKDKHTLRVHRSIKTPDALFMLGEEYKGLCAKTCGAFVATAGEEAITNIINSRPEVRKLAIPGKSGCACNKLIKGGWQLCDCIADIERTANAIKELIKEFTKAIIGG